MAISVSKSFGCQLYTGSDESVIPWKIATILLSFYPSNSSDYPITHPVSWSNKAEPVTLPAVCRLKFHARLTLLGSHGATFKCPKHARFPAKARLHDETCCKQPKNLQKIMRLKHPNSLDMPSHSH